MQTIEQTFNVGDTFENGVIICVMSGYYHLKIMKRIFSDESIVNICSLYKEKYDNWLDETFVVIDMEDLIQTYDFKTNSEVRIPIKRKTMIAAISELKNKETPNRFCVEIKD